MKVLHIIGGNLNGGAARGALWLHHGLLDIGVDSKVLTNSEDIMQDPSIETIVTGNKERLKYLLTLGFDQLPLKMYKNRKKTIFSTSLCGYDLTKSWLYDWADVIHLHWINGGFINIKHLKKINKPVIWTLRDMWPFTGGCHVSMNCERYKTGCGQCVQLGSNKKNDLSRYILNRKKRYYPKNIKVVGISNWISNEAKESIIFSEHDIRTIFNNIDCGDFIPIEKSVAKEVLGLRTEKQIVLAGGIDLKAAYKGFDKYLQAIGLLDKNRHFLAFFGNNDLVESLGFEYKSFNFVHDTMSLRLIYSAADVFVAPSIIESFGKTLTEAMACGTPVVCFDSTGPRDIVDHKINGYKAIPFSSEDLCQGIQWVLNHKEIENINLNARHKALEMFDSKVIAMQYLKLYQTL